MDNYDLEMTRWEDGIIWDSNDSIPGIFLKNLFLKMVWFLEPKMLVIDYEDDPRSFAPADEGPSIDEKENSSSKQARKVK